MSQEHILTLSCPDRVGLVATLARLMERHGCFIASSRTFGDPDTGRFFARLVFQSESGDDVPAGLNADLENAAGELSATWASTQLASR